MAKATRTRRGRLKWIAAAAMLMIGAGAALAWKADAPTPAGTGTQIATAKAPPGYVRRETRPTLAPARFVGKAAVTHQIARDIPEVLDQLYCYCQCDKSIGHKSLLSCYTDGHAAT